MTQWTRANLELHPGLANFLYTRSPACLFLSWSWNNICIPNKSLHGISSDIKPSKKSQGLYVPSSWENSISLTDITNHFLTTSCCCCWVAKSCLTLCDPTDCSPPGSSVHGILQARILEWVAISFSRGSSRPRDWTCVSCLSCTGKQILYHWVTWEVRRTSSSVKSSSSIKSVFPLALSLLLNFWYGGGTGHSLAGIWSEMSFAECLQASGFPCLQLAPQGCPDQARGCWKGHSLSSKHLSASSPFLSVQLFVEFPRGRTWKGLLITLFRAPEEKLNLSANSAWSWYWWDKTSDGLSGTWAIWKLTPWFLWVMRCITESEREEEREARKKEEGNGL